MKTVWVLKEKSKHVEVPLCFILFSVVSSSGDVNKAKLDLK